MAYLINKTDGTVLATVSDGQIDNLTTDLTLIGKNYSGFGEALNENLVKMLENFASTSKPSHPIRGQIWFDVTELKLKVYNGTAFQPVSSATISNIQPTTLTPGDLWFNDIDKQLYFYDGTQVILLGPSYTNSQGVSGLKVSTVLDTLNQSRVVTLLYNNGTLLGIFSKDSFTPKIPIDGFSGDIIPGFNQGTLDGIKFNVTVTNAEQLGGVSSTTYIKNNTNSVISGRLAVLDGLEVGDSQQVKLRAVNGDLLLQNVAANKFVIVSARRGVMQEDAIRIEPETRTINLYKDFTGSSVVVGGSLDVKGNLTVEGDLLTVNTSTVTVEDKNIELAKVTTPTDTTADGGGIILKGSTDKTLTWTNATQAWNSSEHINLAANRYIAIDGTPLIEQVGNTFQLTSAVTLAPGIEIYGVQSEFTIRNVYITGNTISTKNDTLAGGITGDNIDLRIDTKGTGNVVLVGSPKITGLGEPSDIQDAATKNYVDVQLKAKSLAFTMDISDGISNSGIAGWLELIAPVSEYANGTVARILCTSLSNSTSLVDLNVNLNKSTGQVNTPSGVGTALLDVTFSNTTVPAPAVIVSRLVKTFQILGGAWTFIS